MTPEDIKKLPTPETEVAWHEDFEDDSYKRLVSLSRLNEQRLAAAVIALEDLWKNSYYANAPTEMENAEETLASIRNMK